MRTFRYVFSDQIHFHRALHLRPRRIPYYRFLQVESGRGEFTITGQKFQVGPGWLGLLAPGRRENRYRAALPVSYLYVEFASEQGLIEKAYAEMTPREPRRTALTALLQTIHLQRGDPGGCLLAAAVQLLMPEPALQNPASIDPRLAEVLRLIEHRPDCNRSVAELAGAVDLSEPQLRRLFRVQLGLGPKQYLMRIRMEFAQRLLRHEGMRVGQAAELLGFASVFQFSAQYKRIMGHPPSEERRR